MSTEDQMSIEDRVRTATRAGASLIRDVRPLGAPAPVRLRHRPRPAPRRWVAWAVPLAAAAAVMAIALTLVAVRQPGATAPAGGQSATATAPAAVPRYYATLKNDPTTGTYEPLIVGDDHTGKVIDTVSPPRGLVFKNVQGTSADGTFVVMAAGSTKPTGAPPYTLYLLRISPGSTHPYQLTKMPIRLPGNSPTAFAYALSPDGRELAVESQPSSAGAGHVATLGIYSVSSGAMLRAWTTSTAITPALGVGTLTWLSGGRQLVFTVNQFTAGATYNQELRTLDVTAAGTDLLAASRMLLTVGYSDVSACVSLDITPDGATAICATQYPFRYGSGSNAGCANGGVEFIAYSVRTGRPVRTLYQYREACHEGVSYLPWTDASGNSVIGVIDINPGNEGGKQAVQVGVITDGHLRPLKIASFSSPWAYASLVF